MGTVVARKRGHLDIRLLGHLEIALDGEPFRLSTPRKSLQVLAYLLLHRAAPVSREYLAFLLYPDDEEGAARSKLRATLRDMLRAMPQPVERYVYVDAEKLAWNQDADAWLDVDAFVEASSDRGRLAEAIDLYRGDLLPELYDEWLDAIRERHRNAYLRCLAERVSEARRNADHALAIETARRILAVDPWREDVVRRIISMRYESGDRAGALREYEEFANRLRAEMGTEPMAETAAVAEGIARGDAIAETDADDEWKAGAGSAVLPFVGRRDEMDRLLETWGRVARGRGACAFVGGESGIGKSRIALELAHAVEDRGGRVLFGATSAPEAQPYESVVDALRSALPLVASLKPSIALACVATLLPEIQVRVGLPPVPRLDAESERIRLYESLFRCLADLAAARPLLLVLEDLHWAQPASLELLQFLLRRIAGVPVMIVVTHRDEDSPALEALQRLRREARATGGAQNLWLTRFSVNDVEELRTNLADVRDRPAETLIAASQGNPLFLTQLVVEVREGDGAAAPPSLQAAVERRVERLSDPARTVAEIAACIGDRFSLDALREVSAWDEGALADALDELLDRRIIREGGGRGILEYAFSHHLVHDAIVHAISPKDAATRRRRVARVLERLYPERVTELSALLAGHYEAAGDVENAARCYLAAVRRSISVGALNEARTQCERGLALDLTPRARAELLLERVTLESRRGDRETWNAALVELERVDAQLGDVDAASLDAAAPNRAGVHHRRQRHARARRARPARVHADGRPALERGAASFRGQAGVRAGPPRRSVRGRRGGAGGQPRRGRRRRHHAGDLRARKGSGAPRPALRRRGPLRRGGGGRRARRGSAARTARAEQRMDRRVSAPRHQPVFRARQRYLELAVKLGDRPAEAHAHDRLAIALTAAGSQYAQAREHFATANRIYVETGNVTGRAGLLLNQALLETRLGFFDRAAANTEKAVELFDSAKDERGRVGGLTNLIFLRAYTGNIEGAREAGELALQLARRLGYGLLEASALENLGNAEAAAGNYARAIELAEASFAVRSDSESQVWSSKTLADVAIWHATLGNLPAARDAIARMTGRRGRDHAGFGVAGVLLLGGGADLPPGRRAARSVARPRQGAAPGDGDRAGSRARRPRALSRDSVARRPVAGGGVRRLARPAALVMEAGSLRRRDLGAGVAR